MFEEADLPPFDSAGRLRTLVGRRNFLFGAAMAGAVVVSQLRMPVANVKAVSKKTFESWVPNKVGEWSFLTSSGVVVPPPDELSDRLYDHVITRVYQAPNAPVVMVALAYNNAQNGVVQLHRPEVCYPAGGYQLSETKGTTIKTASRVIPVNIFTAVGPSRTEQVMYWTRIGTDFPLTWSRQRYSVMEANLAGTIPDGILVRVSLVGENQKEARTTLERFVRQFELASATPLQKIMLG